MVRQFVLTLDTTVQSLGSVLTQAEREGSERYLQFLSLQPAGANAGVIYVGGGVDAAISSSNYGFRLEIGSSGVPPAPFVFENLKPSGLKLSDLRVVGANNEKLHIFAVFY